ncbi:MAG: NADH:ubiquinone oxidoreductase [Desulfuromonadaceae bacterium]|nr:NADH:ubiquinone oxidoreductase [Desulfuromonadaceae bacterium]MDD2854528.1 NADH:ubiquinone oxidoreductase [Desulfuromonadaceae bacterium]
MKKLRLAITGMTACSGCQLSLLNCENELPDLLEKFDFSFFPLASSPLDLIGEYDASIVEGCVSMPHEKKLLLELRNRSRYLIAVGTCAVFGGVAALKNDEEREVLRKQVYGSSSIVESTFRPLPLNNLVQVDASITGCPPEKMELLRLLGGLLAGALPVDSDYPVCTECRIRENICLLTERGELCLGMLVSGGCHARCPSMAVPCEGCRGPLPEANLREALRIYAEKGFDRETVFARLRRFCPEWRL